MTLTQTSATDLLSEIVPSRAATRLREYRRDADAALPGRVVGVLLFGSRARGDASRTSDYDVAVLVRGAVDADRASDLLADAAYRHILSGVHIRPVMLQADALEQAAPGSLAAMVARDGIVIP